MNIKTSLTLTVLALQLLLPAKNTQALELTNKIPYSDINGQTVYLNSILELANRNVISGNPDGTFRPNNCVNRAEFLKMLFVAQDIDLNDMPSGGAGYTDLDSNEWYYPYVKIATVKGTVSGYPDGTFKPSQCVNRVEAIKMAVNEFDLQLDLADQESIFPHYHFSDIDKSAWYYNFFVRGMLKNIVGTANLTKFKDELGNTYTINNTLTKKENEEIWFQNYVNAGGDLLIGWLQKYFYPDQFLTRQEASEMIYRSLTIKEKNLTAYPFDYSHSSFINTFDSCGILSDYDDNNWYQDLITKLEAAGENNRLNQQDMPYATESCLSLDGLTMITLLASNYLEGNSRIFKYNVATGNLYEANYYLFNDNRTTANMPHLPLTKIKTRNGQKIEITGGEIDGGYGTAYTAQYHYNENAVYLQKTCLVRPDTTSEVCTSTGY